MTVLATAAWLVTGIATWQTIKTYRRARRDRAPDAATDMTVSCGNCETALGNVLGEIRGNKLRVSAAQALALAANHDCPEAPHHHEEN